MIADIKDNTLIIDGTSNINIHNFLDLLKCQTEKSPMRTELDIKALIESIDAEQIKKKITNTFDILIQAEKVVHKNDSSFHLHEVSRDENFANLISIFFLIERLCIKNVIVRNLSSGNTTIKCSHGEIETPVPAVKCLCQIHNIKLKIDDSIKTENITPMGLSLLISLNAKFE